MFEVDCRGLSCPIPLVRLQKAMAAHPNEPILMRVDSETAREHATRLAEGKNYDIKMTKKEDEIDLEMTPRK